MKIREKRIVLVLGSLLFLCSICQADITFTCAPAILGLTEGGGTGETTCTLSATLIDLTNLKISFSDITKVGGR